MAKLEIYAKAPDWVKRELARGKDDHRSYQEFEPTVPIASASPVTIAAPDPNRRVFVIGYPGAVGGANTELGHTVRLWREYGMDVHLIPTWGEISSERRKPMDAIGCVTHLLKPREITRELLAGAPLVSFGNPLFLEEYGRLRRLGCPVVYVGCMTAMSSDERRTWKTQGTADAYVFQSDFQASVLEQPLRRLGYSDERGHRIPGAFWWRDWEYKPLVHEPYTDFVVGRIARADPMKWWTGMFGTLGGVPDIRMICLGLDKHVRGAMGRIPSWASVYGQGGMDTLAAYRQMHAMVCVGAGAQENWPQVVLEAFATGVPVVAEDKFGYREMIEHGYSGFLAKNYAEVVDYLSDLGADEELRVQVAENAREQLEGHLAEPGLIWRGWCELFRSIGKGELSS